MGRTLKRLVLGFLPSMALMAPIVAGAASPASASSCAVTIGGKTGYYICGTNISQQHMKDGSKSWTRAYVIGTNHAVWNIFVEYVNGVMDYNSGWQSLGGYAINGPWSYYEFDTDPYTGVKVEVEGSDHNLWCDYLVNDWYGYGQWYWSGWSRC